MVNTYSLLSNQNNETEKTKQVEYIIKNLYFWFLSFGIGKTWKKCDCTSSRKKEASN